MTFLCPACWLPADFSSFHDEETEGPSSLHLPLSSATADLPGPPGHEGDRGAGEVGGETGDNVSW